MELQYRGFAFKYSARLGRLEIRARALKQGFPTWRAEKGMIRPQLLWHGFHARERSSQHFEHAGRGIASELRVEFDPRVVAHECASPLAVVLQHKQRRFLKLDLPVRPAARAASAPIVPWDKEKGGLLARSILKRLVLGTHCMEAAVAAWRRRFVNLFCTHSSVETLHPNEAER
jgi:hypothetical protein